MTWEEIKAEAFGKIGLLPWDFFKMTFDEYELFREGYDRKLLDYERMLRTAVLTAISPWLKSVPNPFQVWGLRHDDELKRSFRAFKISPENEKRLAEFKEKERTQNASAN